ncbi:coproporphyrinogen III oxidase [Corynebacterium poyangense]|uniref:Heme chaperone HemW n=1 Tax=Corynebacterium poyangense TaxID=2684405 RepID=A0A7H0SQ21_9CORY|nr:radical SAM family heme chaperone HemW [Corynebacterium poyangense]MBZ8178422.1 coproporphyrinogen III oxidase [Corynebacterium poyangense]QNQ90646.1 coproporphyrinogen III oxidase [Corynebacterium poyangense]
MVTPQPTDPGFGVYIHVPFCASRCGYCDFNTYTPGELGSSASPHSYLEALEQELELAAAMPETQPADTIFIGGGTPSLLGAEALARIICVIERTFGITPGAEITTESNPESTSPEFFEKLLAAGFTRLSLGMQSTAPHVLRVLQRQHTPGRALAAAREAKAAGFSHLNLDVIYGTPGETDQDLERTLSYALGTGVDHISAYSLIIEDGTAMARKIRSGELPEPDPDVLAERYQIIDTLLSSAGLEWYEVSNWALPGGECRHNLIYWTDGHWWGAGPGAHSHLGKRRFANVKHPARYARELSAGCLPIAMNETLTAEEQHMEKIMLGLRLRRGIPRDALSPAASPLVEELSQQGLIEVSERRIRVSEAGRLLADGIIRDLLLAEEEQV